MAITLDSPRISHNNQAPVAERRVLIDIRDPFSASSICHPLSCGEGR